MMEYEYRNTGAFPFVGSVVEIESDDAICMVWDKDSGEKIAEALNILEASRVQEEDSD